MPCHRVVRSDGKVGGFASGTQKKMNMLHSEGVKVMNGKVLGLENYLYKK